ncbi:NAD(P)-dependent oxidoreductase [Aestuariibius insulae]|uniref:NAD(P)-dependent oxidoreductase n=1 Tax=Aestuariibius insulae TaxID=2058287 RepID=UPI00345E3C20
MSSDPAPATSGTFGGRGVVSVGVAGCGRMGLPMLRALQRAGFQANGFDIRLDAPADIETNSATFAADLTILLTVVRDDAQTDALLFDTQCLIEHAPNLTHLIVCSTLSPRYIADLRNRLPARVHLIDAPMSGAQIAAEEARLSFIIGGDPDQIDALMPLFMAMGAHQHYMGPLGAGMQAKVFNNLLAAASTAMTRQVLGWADAAGLDEARFLDLVNTSSGRNWLTLGFNEIEFARDGWAEDNSIGILTKDVDAALDALPDTADTALAEEIRRVIRTLHPHPSGPRTP